MNTGLWLITSGAFVGQELAAEFGQMPPSFLPVGTKRLYEYQLDRIGAGTPIYLTLPETYVVQPEDLRRLAAADVSILFVPDGLSLGESVVFALNIIGGGDQPVRILHGDTLIDKITNVELDHIGIVASGDGYTWAEVELADNQIIGMETVSAGIPSNQTRPIACGYFAFAHSTALVRGITRARGNFISGMLDYAKAFPLHATIIDGWYDFGHVQTFFRSRRVVTNARHFNSLRIDGRTARKSSADSAKMRAEAAWLDQVPPTLRIYSARLIDTGEDAEGKTFYETEYGYLPTLQELFVFGSLGAPAWSHVLRSCEDFLSACAATRSCEPADPLLRELAVSKTITRLRRFADDTGFNVDGMLCYDEKPLPSLMQIAEDVAGLINLNSGRSTHVMHGDFCFSNILYNSRVQRIQVIDPRGYVVVDKPTMMGDIRYDMAKFAHSVVGRYDQIIAGRYNVEATDAGRFMIEFEQSPHHQWLERELGHFTVDGVQASSLEVRAITICLFLSMLPLHADRPDRQKAFVANALRLYASLETASV